MDCYDGPNPVKDEERYAIWKWAKENGIDQGLPIEQVHDAINKYFFGGQAKPEWINDILSGRKTPFRAAAKEIWRKQYNRRVVIMQARQMLEQGASGKVAKVLNRLRFIPRSVSVAGHGIVFPVTHAGDLLLRPASWGTFIKGTARTYRGALSSEFAARALNTMSKQPLYELSLQSGLDVGPKSSPVGLISTAGGKSGFFKAAARAWDMLTVMRYDLWEKEMGKYITPETSQSEVLDIGKNLAQWANHATGSGKGPIANLGGQVLFGPKLTQAKLNRLSIDPYQTAKTFLNWKDATVGQKAAAWTRLSGAAQYLGTLLGFVAVNQGLLSAFGSDDKVNINNPEKSDFLGFKGAGIGGYIPGMHTEIRTLAKLLNTLYASRKELKGETKSAHIAATIGKYGMAKLEPGIERGLEIGTGQNWMGRPLPWSSNKGTPKYPRLTYGEYAGSIGPIPLEGPIGFVYDHLRKQGASAVDAAGITKALIILGGGLPGFHVGEDYTSNIPSAVTGSASLPGGHQLKGHSLGGRKGP